MIKANVDPAVERQRLADLGVSENYHLVAIRLLARMSSRRADQLTTSVNAHQIEFPSLYILIECV